MNQFLNIQHNTGDYTVDLDDDILHHLEQMKASNDPHIFWSKLQVLDAVFSAPEVKFEYWIRNAFLVDFLMTAQRIAFSLIDDCEVSYQSCLKNRVISLDLLEATLDVMKRHKGNSGYKKSALRSINVMIYHIKQGFSEVAWAFSGQHSLIASLQDHGYTTLDSLRYASDRDLKKLMA